MLIREFGVSAMKTEISRHAARGEDGKSYSIIVWLNSDTMRTSSGGESEPELTRELSTADGQPVTRICRGEYQNSASGLLLYSEDSDAP
jgi:hypothetical protein